MTEAIQKAIDRVFDELYYRIVLNATQDEVQKTSIMVNVSRMMTLKKEIEEELGGL